MSVSSELKSVIIGVDQCVDVQILKVVLDLNDLRSAALNDTERS